MTSSPSKPTQQEVHYWFSKAGLISVVAMALLIFVGQTAISRMIAPLTPLTAKIQAASNQAVRAQNISIFATNLAASKRPGLLYTYRTQLVAELNEFVAVHRGLLYGDASRGLSPTMSANVHELLLSPENGLDRFARDFEDRVRRDFLSDALTVEDHLADGLQDDIQLLLSPRLLDVTAQLSQEARMAISRIYAAQIFLIAIAVLLMMILGRFVYRPLAKRVLESIHDDADQKSQSALRFDEVTGLANRTHLFAFMADLCKFGKQHDLKFAVLDIEVTGIDIVRDTLDIADVNVMIAMIARRIESVSRSGDFLARIGDNEFVVVLTSFEDDTALNDVTNALRTKLSLPFALEKQSFSLKTKIGIKIADQKDQVPGAILNQAATALKISKASDNYDIQFFSKSLAPRANQREKEFQQIEKGLKSGEFVAHFQPIIDIKTDATLGLEALVRWNHPTRGVLSPIHFMETVQNRELTNDMSRAVLGDALKALREWQSQDIEVPYISINLEPEQLEDRTFVDELKWIADSYNQDPTSIALELSEKVFLPSSPASIPENIKRLADYGFRIIMDDFGTFGVNLQSIKDVPFEYVKIDRAFITNIDSEALQQNTTQDLIGRTKKHRSIVVAEGVETPAERAVLHRMEVDAIQGYLICYPVAASPMTQWLKASSAQGMDHQEAV